MRRRATLTAIWFASLVIAILIVESYFLRHVVLMGQSVPVLTSMSRPAMYAQLAQIYSPSLLLIGAAWFARPLKPITNSRVEHWRFRIALAGTLLFNGIVLGLLALHHLTPAEGSVLASFTQAKTTSLVMTFLVAWPNVHYFGATPPATGKA